MITKICFYRSNFLRLLILRVMQESEKHLDKILSVDEFVRRIFIVMYSNDPVARALTLRTLGSIASVVKDRSNVHHSIRYYWRSILFGKQNLVSEVHDGWYGIAQIQEFEWKCFLSTLYFRTSLESNDAVELEAAIFACSRLSAVSHQFASSICPIVAHMMKDLSTPVDIKLKLLSVFSNMTHDAQTANQVCNAVENITFILFHLLIMKKHFFSKDFENRDLGKNILFECV